MRKLAIFMPIKLNSERVPEKSIKVLFKRPLLNWSLEALDSLDMPIYVYTSDIMAVSRNIDFKYKNLVFIKRPSFLDKSDIIGEQIYKEFVKEVVAENYLLVHCTSPFVSGETYRKIINIGLSSDCDSISTCRKIKSFCFFKNQKINFTERVRTQNLEPIISENSAAYFFKRNVLESGSRSGDKHLFFELSRIESVDLDYSEDFEFLNFIKDIN